DQQFALPRGGAELALSTRSVAVIGCGAVGGYLARFALQLGVGKAVLVDKETLSEENICRHVLGAVAVGKLKAVALAEGLRKDFPHTNVEPQNADARIAFRDGGSGEVDLLINASGDETLGLLINE